MNFYLKHIATIFLLFLSTICYASSTRTQNEIRVEQGLKALQAKKPQEAFKIWKPLAEQGYTDAQFYLGALYLEGSGITQNHLEGIKWLEKAANSEHILAQHALGDIYFQKQKFIESAKWYQKAAEQGDAEAQFNLGSMHSLGQGVELSLPKAIEWYKKSAEQDNTKAQINLAMIYLQGGVGVERNCAQSFNLMKKAAEQDNSLAQLKLAIMYLDELGVEYDINSAKKWLNKACNNSEQLACELLKGELKKSTLPKRYCY